jgi:2-hydroxychromene-2-carboxylate isomerase
LEAATPAEETPKFIVDGEMFWGKDRMPRLEEWIRTGGW